jgi:hypothetical protein
MLPFGRGFDTSFHYQEGAMDHWSSCNCVDGMCSAPNNGYSNGPNSSSATEHCWATIATPDAAPVDDCRAEPGCKDGAHGAGPGTLLEMKGTGMADLWCTDQPCYGRNNTGEYNDLLFTQEAIRLIEENDPRVPFFMYFALQVNHSPLEVPFEYMDKYPAEQYWNQRIMNGAKKTPFFVHVLLNKTIHVLPRQARDTYRKRSGKMAFILQECLTFGTSPFTISPWR